MDFETYLISKKIDSAALLKAEPKIWKTWKYEFDQVHPKSFTAQKLYLINPIRRKYPLKQDVEKTVDLSESSIREDSPETVAPTPASLNPKPAIPRPVFKPKPKTN